MLSKMRLFIALGPFPNWTAQQQQSLQKLKISFKQRDIDGLWVPQDNFHITLSFLGDREEAELPEIYARVEELASLCPPLRLRTKGLGAFPELESARVIFADVRRSKNLLEIQSKLETALKQEPETDYHPHISLYRLRNLKSARKLIEPWRNQFAGEIMADSIQVFKSVQQGAYRVYVPLASFALTGQEKSDEPEPASLFELQD